MFFSLSAQLITTCCIISLFCLVNRLFFKLGQDYVRHLSRCFQAFLFRNRINIKPVSVLFVKGKCIKPCDDENRELAGFGYNRVKGECGENCKEGYEFDSQGKCQEIPETPSTTMTTQSDKTEDVVEEDAEKSKLPLLIGGIAILSIGGLYAFNK